MKYGGYMPPLDLFFEECHYNLINNFFVVRANSMSAKSNETLHNQLIRKACENGWKKDKWKASFRKYVQQMFDIDDDIEEIIEVVNEMPCIPDAWRFRVEGKKEGWGIDKILVLELLEVEVTSPVSDDKLAWYENLWWAMESSYSLHLRLFRMDQYGYVLPLITEYTISDLIQRRYSNSVEYKEISNMQNVIPSPSCSYLETTTNFITN